MLFYHQITCIFMIYVYLLQKFVVAIYAVFPPIVLAWKLDSANFFTFRMYVDTFQWTVCSSVIKWIEIASIVAWYCFRLPQMFQ